MLNNCERWCGCAYWTEQKYGIPKLGAKIQNAWKDCDVNGAILICLIPPKNCVKKANQKKVQFGPSNLGLFLGRKHVHRFDCSSERGWTWYANKVLFMRSSMEWQTLRQWSSLKKTMVIGEVREGFGGGFRLTAGANVIRDNSWREGGGREGYDVCWK